MPATYTVTSDTTKVWASAKIKDAPPNTKVTLIWYYIKDNKLEKIYQKSVSGKGFATLMSDLKWKGNHTFAVGEYRVDFYLGEESVRSLYFTIVPPPPAQSATVSQECIKPTKADNKIFISDTLQSYPTMKNKVNVLDLKQYRGKGHRFSTILPQVWKISKNTSPDILLSLTSKSQKGKKSQYIIRELSLKTLTELTEDNSTVMQTAVDLLTEASLKVSSESKITISPKVIKLPDMIIGHYEVVHTKNAKKGWERHTIIYDGKYLYDLILFTKDEDPAFRGFLSTLSVYSFWSKESCIQQ